MDVSEWLRAVDLGIVNHSWTAITIEYDGHVGVFKVSTDAARVLGVRHTCTPIAAQQAADALNALFLTSKLYEERWRQASVQIPPCFCDVVKDDANVHSAKVTTQIRIAKGTPGDLVADVGKAWIIDPKCTSKKAVNHGWIVGHLGIAWDAGGRPSWKGVPVSPTTGISGEYMVQNRGAAHGLYHEDYSQVLLLVHGECVVDGETMRTADVYTDPELCGLVLPNQLRLTFTRQPGVVVGSSTPPPSSTEPSPVSSAETFSGTVGARAVAFAEAERDDGVKEEPNGSNNGPRIKDYLGPCVRDGKPNLGGYLAKTGANWCAAFFWFCQGAVSAPSDSVYPYRCSGLESENDAKARGAWRDKQLALDGKWEPAEGDGVILKRGTKPWQRHVCRYMRRVNDGHFETIGGNEKNHIKITLRRFDDPRLLGFIEMPRDADASIDVIITEPLIVTPGNQLGLDFAIDDQDDGEKAK